MREALKRESASPQKGAFPLWVKQVAAFLATAAIATGGWYVRECRSERRSALSAYENAFANNMLQEQKTAQITRTFTATQDAFMEELGKSPLDERKLAEERQLLLAALIESVNECDKSKVLRLQYQVSFREVERAFSFAIWTYFQNVDTHEWELVTNEEHWCAGYRENLSGLQQMDAHYLAVRADVRSQIAQEHSHLHESEWSSLSKLVQSVAEDKEWNDKMISFLEVEEDRTLLACWDCLIAFTRITRHPPHHS
jgi:hypothetical protein